MKNPRLILVECGGERLLVKAITQPQARDHLVGKIRTSVPTALQVAELIADGVDMEDATAKPADEQIKLPLPAVVEPPL